MFRHRQQLRRWAARVLLLWLFGVGAGIANACLAPSTFGLAGHGPVLAGQALQHGADRAHHVDTADYQAPTAKSNCQDFCDKATVSIPPLKSALDDVQGLALPPRATTSAAPVPAFLPVRLWVPRRDGVLAPPIPIAFLRLAL